MASRLVETVLINVEDFADSFLTCGTCLCAYNANEHAPKLLPCSHTICRVCLERILDNLNPHSAGGVFRCPICREGIAVPPRSSPSNAGSPGAIGADAFPPSFLVNQLRDLLANQRRDLIPKCSQHPTRELLYCETCDQAFCPSCLPPGGHGLREEGSVNTLGVASTGPDNERSDTGSPGAVMGGGHNAASSGHNVISFGIAMKRMSEILLYKAHLCLERLGCAYESVAQEVGLLERNEDACIQSINTTFDQMTQLLQKRRDDLLFLVQKVGAEKRASLREQLEAIDAEKENVRRDCDQFQLYRIQPINQGSLPPVKMEVGEVSKKIAYLNEKLDTFSTLTEPRENAFMRFECPEPQVQSFASDLTRLGNVQVSPTCPGLCTAVMENSAVRHLQTRVLLATFDRNGQPRRVGSEPVHVELTDPVGHAVSCSVKDKTDGTYSIEFRPQRSGKHKLALNVLNRPIRSSPLLFEVESFQNPLWSFGLQKELLQPFAITSNRSERRLYVLDTGNDRVVVIDADSGQALLPCIGQEAMYGQAGTGVTWAASYLWIVNWRRRRVYQIDPLTNETTRTFPPCEHFREPTSLAMSEDRCELFVADNGAGRILVFDSRSGVYKRDIITGIKHVSGLAVTRSELVVAEKNIKLYSWDGRLIRQFAEPSDGGQFGDVACSGDELVTARVLKSCVVLQVYQLSTGQLRYNLELGPAGRLRRPAGVIALSDGTAAVVDLVSSCVHKYRYK